MRYLMMLVLSLAVFVGMGQDTIQRVFFGSSGDDEFVKAFERPNDLLMFGSVDNGSNLSDIYIVQTTKDLKKSTYHKIGTSSIERVVDVFVDTTNFSSYVLLDYSSGFDSTGYDLKVIKLDSSFNQTEEYLIANVGVDISISVEINDEHVFVIRSEDDLFHLTSFSTDLDFESDFSLELKTDSFEIVDFIATDSGFFVLGNALVSVDNYDIFIKGYNDQGSEVADWIFGDSLNEKANHFFFKDSTHLIVSGSSQSFNNQPDYDAMIFQVDDTGSLNWLQIHGFAIEGPFNDDFGIQAQMFGSNRILFGVYTQTYGFGNGDYHIYLLSSQGGYISGNSYGFPERDRLEGFIRTSEKRIIMFGESNSGSIGGEDILVVATDTAAAGGIRTTSVLADSSNVETLKVYDQISVSEIDFTCYERGKLQVSGFTLPSFVRVFDTQGSLLLSKDCKSESNVELDLLERMNQPLIIQIEGLQGTYVQKIQIQD
ncbi:MAG: hypothetical protein NWR97_02110 [Salibacteraceae bacterium]|jgi:hypothetical protein|nr:hypothetical protein [Salibacteraceae bacterium]